MWFTASKPKALALVDCNSFFCSCERVFNPKLKNKPVVVLSGNDGCVISRTQEAKDLGIPMGVPYFKIRDFLKKHQVFVYSSNFALYEDMSGRVIRLLRELSPQIEVYSIDEAFIDLSGIPCLEAFVRVVRARVLKEIGIPVSIGVAPTKVLAKVANRLAKKDPSYEGLAFLSEEKKVETVLSTLQVEDIWGIGWRSAEKLRAQGVYTADEFRREPSRGIQKLLGVTGRRMQKELWGESCLLFEEVRADKKQIISSQSFGRPVYELSDLKEAVARYMTKAVKKLRRQSSRCLCVHVFIRSSEFVKNRFYEQTFVVLEEPTSTLSTLIQVAFRALERIYRPKIAYKKAGVMISHFSQEERHQLSLFGRSSQKENKLMSTLEAIHRHWGDQSIYYGACGVRAGWKARSDYRSVSYTTRWKDLLVVKT